MGSQLIYLASRYSDDNATIRSRRAQYVRAVEEALREQELTILSPISVFHGLATIHRLPKDATFWRAVNNSLQWRAGLVVYVDFEADFIEALSTSQGCVHELDLALSQKQPVILFRTAEQPTAAEILELTRRIRQVLSDA